MNKFFKYLSTIFTIIAGIAAVIGLYLQYSEKIPEIEIQSITTDKLTDLPKIDGLDAKYYYKDSIVSSLWMLNYHIKNKGNEIIIGQGEKKNIILSGITFYLPDNFRILDINLKNNDFQLSYTVNGREIIIDFLQWKPEEGFEFTIYAEQLSNQTEPSLQIIEREIIQGEVTYTNLYNTKLVEKPIFEYLPRTIQSIIKWMLYIVFAICITVLPIAWVVELNKYLKFKKWKKENHSIYKDWINDLFKNKKIPKLYEPQELPFTLWDDYPYPQPTLLDNNFLNLTVGVFVFIVITLIPILLLIKI